jgi:hypothetical protein
MADTTESWLYDEGEDCKKNEYVEKLQQLQVGSNDILLQCYLGKVLILFQFLLRLEFSCSCTGP